MGAILRQFRIYKPCLLLGTVVFVLVALGTFSAQQDISSVVMPSKPNLPKQDMQHKEDYMLYPLQLDSLPKVVSSIIDGMNNSGVKAINNIYNNSFAIHPKSRCTRPLAVLVLIKTCYQNKEKRMALRQTWANSKYLSKLDVPIEYAFILGHGIYNGESAKEDLMDEVAEEGDMIMANFLDSYRNNTFKSMAGLFWSIEHCKDYEFLVMVDDDIYLSLPNLISFLTHPNSYPESNKEKANGKFAFQSSGNEVFWGGFVYSNPSPPIRDPANKWYVTWEEYPFTSYPIFIPGGTILYSRNVSLQFVLASQFVKHLSLDDVYLSIIAAKLSIKPFTMNNLVLNEWSWKKGNQDQEMNAISIHGLQSPSKLIQYWKKYEH